MYRCVPTLDERRQHKLMWYAYIIMLIALWAWQGAYLIFAAASRIDVECEVVFVLSRHAIPAVDYEVLADFQQINTTRRTGNVTVLADGNLTQGVAAERAYAIGSRHTCLYYRNKRRLTYDPDMPPLRALPSVVVHIAVFAFLCVIIVIAILQMRYFTAQSEAPASLIKEHARGGWQPPETELVSFRSEDDDEIIVFAPAEPEREGAAVLVQ